MNDYILCMYDYNYYTSMTFSSIHIFNVNTKWYSSTDLTVI